MKFLLVCSILILAITAEIQAKGKSYSSRIYL